MYIVLQQLIKLSVLRQIGNPLYNLLKLHEFERKLEYSVQIDPIPRNLGQCWSSDSKSHSACS